MVSVIIPAYNRAHTLPRAINSVLAQTYPDFEIIVVNDYSSDNTDDLMKSFIDPRIRYIKCLKNEGGAAARNVGLEASRGEFIAFLDSDDEWLEDKLNQQVSVFQSVSSSIGLIYVGQKILDDNGQELGFFLGEKHGSVFNDIVAGNYIGSLSAVIVRSEYVRQIKGFDKGLKSCQDWDFYIRLSQVCQFQSINEYLVKYYINRNDPARISSNRSSLIAGHEAIQRKYVRHINQLPYELKVRHFEYMRDIYASAGDLKKVLYLTLVNTFKLRSFVPIFSTPRFIGRCIKRNIFKNYGY